MSKGIAQADSRVPFLLGAMFLLSGAVALIYEAAWQRQFTLLFGSAAPATAAVLAAYFTGLGLGSYVLGKWGARGRQPLRVYGILEWIIAAGALLVAPLLTLFAEFYPGLFSRFGHGATVFLVVKGLLAFAAIAVPAMAMGGTLPVLAQLFENRRTRFGELAGWLYMLNTAGAAIGVLLFPALLSALGMRNTSYLCAGLNVLIGAGAFVMAKRTASPALPPAIVEKVSPAAPVRMWVALAFASGFVTFVLQVGWTRAFGLIRENSVYSFSLIVALFIAAIAAGAQLARLILRWRWSPRKSLAGAWIAGGILTLIGPFVFAGLSGGLKFAPEGDGGSAVSAHFMGTALAVIFVPVVLLAAALPLILQEAADASKRQTGNLTGTILAANIAGSVGGAIAAGFVFPWVIGMWGTISLTGALVVAIAGLLLAKSPARRIAFVCGCAAAGWLASLADLPRTRLDKKAGEKLLALKEGAHGVVAVLERPDSRRMKVNNHYLLGGTLAIGDERMQAHIPLLLHPNPQRVAFLGYGTGITAGGAFFHAPQQVTALELVPEVAEMATSFFAEANGNFAAQPTARLIIDDARNYLRGATEQFDVIIGDLVVPWRHGEGALYTLEHFAAARARLADGGLYCAWLPMFQLGREDFRSILSTFLKIFPGAQVWRGDFSPAEPALALVGFAADGWNPATPQRRVEQVQPDPTNPQLKYARALWMHFVGIAGADSSPLNTEDLPRVELRMKRPPPFVGRELQTWENQISAGSASLRETLPPEAVSGWDAGALMKEFTLLMMEERNGEANAIQKQVRTSLGEEVARSVLGN